MKLEERASLMESNIPAHLPEYLPLSASFSPWLNVTHMCVHLHRTPQPGPGWDESPCHVWKDLNHLEDEQLPELPSDILMQHSAENKILE